MASTVAVAIAPFVTAHSFPVYFLFFAAGELAILIVVAVNWSTMKYGPSAPPSLFRLKP